MVFVPKILPANAAFTIPLGDFAPLSIPALGYISCEAAWRINQRQFKYYVRRKER
jgi:hypothetical protein